MTTFRSKKAETISLGKHVYHCSGVDWFESNTILAPPYPQTNEGRQAVWKERLRRVMVEDYFVRMRVHCNMFIHILSKGNYKDIAGAISEARSRDERYRIRPVQAAHQ